MPCRTNERRLYRFFGFTLTFSVYFLPDFPVASASAAPSGRALRVILGSRSFRDWPSSFVLATSCTERIARDGTLEQLYDTDCILNHLMDPSRPLVSRHVTFEAIQREVVPCSCREETVRPCDAVPRSSKPYTRQIHQHQHLQYSHLCQ